MLSSACMIPTVSPRDADDRPRRIFPLAPVVSAVVFPYAPSKPFEEAQVNDDLAELIDHTECGGTLALKAGTYHLTKALKITKPIQISGAGINRTRIMNSTGDSIMHFDCAGELKLSGLSLLWQISERTEKSAVSIKNGNFQMEDCALVVELDRYETFCVRNARILTPK